MEKLCDCNKLMEMEEKLEDYMYEHFDSLNLHELGEITDMIKDLSKSMYYCKKMECTPEEEIDEYMTELNDDLNEMLSGATAEEKQTIVTKLTAIKDKIQSSKLL